ncbi:MAG TPA: helix-turn-helix domain-containing protein [Novosphingobium sp.]|nr:helix-turn-helix domain-containing protein [Novosphingobium sp.]
MRTKRPGERRSSSRSATRALDVLELFGSARRPLRAIEVGRALDLNPSTTNQLLKTMVDSAHLVFNARSKTYLPSPRLTSFSGWIIETYGAGGQVQEVVKDVQERTGLVVTVSTPNDLFMQIVDFQCVGDKGAERGLRVPLFDTTIGGAFLSTLEQSEIERLAYRARIAPARLPSVLETLAVIAARGYTDGESGGDIWSVAVPVPDHGLHVPMVLGLSGSVEAVRDRSEELARIMRDAIHRRFSGPEARPAPE